MRPVIQFSALALMLHSGQAYSLDPNQTVELLRKYCKACHAAGEKRFITSENNNEVWDYIFSNSASNGNVWAKEMIRVLDWPSEEPPPPKSLMEPGREWMPVGSKRYDIASDVIENIDARRAIRDRLQLGP